MRIMVLGGGSCQMNLIRRAKNDGHEIVLVDYLPDCPGRALADVYLPLSTFDTQAVLRAAKDYAVEGVVTTGTDQPVYTAAVLAEELGLHFYIDSITAKAVTNKRVMKKLFEDAQIPHAPYRLIERDFRDEEIAGIRFPAVLKPVDSQGQRGVLLVNNVQEVRRHIGETLSFSREDRVLLEEYYKSDELTVNGWVAEGTLTILSVVDRVTIKNTKHIGICLCHHFPSIHLAAYSEQIQSVTERIVSSLNIKNGPIYFQYLLGKDGLIVNEIAMRVGGAYEDLTIPRISGIDILGLLLDSILYGRCDISAFSGYELKNNRTFVSTQLFFCKPGRVRFITPKEELQRLAGVCEIGYAIGENSLIQAAENATARAGYIILEAASFAQLIERVNTMFDIFQVLDENGNNLVIKYRDYEGKYLNRAEAT
jgi:biotin carboxylase